MMHRLTAPRLAAWKLLALPLAWLAAAQPVAGQELDELIRARVEQLLDTGALELDGVSIAARTLLPKIYEARSFAPAWRDAAQVDSLLDLIDEAYQEGLDPGDYHDAAVRAAREQFADLAAVPADRRAALDLILTDSVIRVGYHLRFGKVDPIALDSNWNLSRVLVNQDPVMTLQAAIDAPSMRDFAAQVLPRNRLYGRLKTALAEYRAIAAAGGWPKVPDGETLRPGMSDSRVAALERRLAMTGDLQGVSAATAPDETADAPRETPYDGEVVPAVRRFQERHGLAADGVVGRTTLAALNVPVEQRIEQIRASLERARWVLADLGEEFIVVNIAGFHLYLVRGGNIAWDTRVVVGRPYRRTPVFKAEMTYLVLNPTWTVPPTILREDILPAQRRDAGYLAGRNIDVIDGGGRSVDPSTIDWRGQRTFPYRFVQRPGPTNSLGQVKFMFPNDHAVYLHDTPSRELFERASRPFSSGCIRVEDPLMLARLLLEPAWDAGRIDATLATGRTETVFLPKPVDVLLLYWTAEVDEQGRIVFWPDIYERDPGVIAELETPFASTPLL
jgi:murein L,D-transpeptidase YcbB/YkuD